MNDIDAAILKTRMFGNAIAGNSFSLLDPDENNERKFVGPKGEDLGTFHFLGPVPIDGVIQIPDDGVESVAFPTMAGAVRYVGPLQRGVCMFIMHKVNPIVPTTPDLERMVRAFNRHETFDTVWAFKELGVEAVLGPGSAEWIAELAVERGLAVKTKKGYRRA